MELKEFSAEQHQLIDDFVYLYTERKKKGKEHTMFHPEPEWLELFEDFLNSRRGMLDGEDREAA
jgi:hypothetical protein